MYVKLNEPRLSWGNFDCSSSSFRYERPDSWVMLDVHVLKTTRPMFARSITVISRDDGTRVFAVSGSFHPFFTGMAGTPEITRVPSSSPPLSPYPPNTTGSKRPTREKLNNGSNISQLASPTAQPRDLVVNLSSPSTSETVAIL